MSQPKADARVPGIWTIGLASSAGTVIEWYDFYLYGSLAVFFRLFSTLQTEPGPRSEFVACRDFSSEASNTAGASQSRHSSTGGQRCWR